MRYSDFKVTFGIVTKITVRPTKSGRFYGSVKTPLALIKLSLSNEVNTSDENKLFIYPADPETYPDGLFFLSNKDGFVEGQKDI